MSFIEIEKRKQTSSYNMTEPQFHDYYEIYFLTEGTRDFFIENKLYRITAPSLCIIPPFLMHKTEGDAYERINVYLSEDYLSKDLITFLKKLSENYVYSIKNEQMDFISSILNEATKIVSNNTEQAIAMQINFVKTVIYYIQNLSLEPIDEVGFTRHGKNTDESILRLVAYLNENYKERITLDNLSNQFFLSKNTLCGRFKKQMNCSIIGYVTFVRLNKAKMYLSSTDYSMDKIAELCGFPSANYFGLIFKKHYGISPLNYRKKK